MNLNNSLISIKNMCKSFDSQIDNLDVLKNVNLNVNRGELIVIMGPSGSGKSTLLNIMGLLDVPTSGSISYFNNMLVNLSDKEKAKIRSENIGFIFQQFNLLKHLTVYENVMLPLVLNDKLDDTKRKEIALKHIEDMEMTHRLFYYPSTLSGGEQQRVAIARSLVNDPVLILADEPTGNVDQDNGSKIIRTFEKIVSNGKSIVVVTHNDIFKNYASSVYYMENGELKREH
jgi:ABC-type lipoprotein export system ATPase subunit